MDLDMCILEDNVQYNLLKVRLVLKENLKNRKGQKLKYDDY